MRIIHSTCRRARDGTIRRLEPKCWMRWRTGSRWSSRRRSPTLTDATTRVSRLDAARERPMNLYVGTSGYSYKEWKGTFYPEDLPSKQMLHYYGERFRSVEINNTFYRMPKPSVLAAWASEVPPDFKFVLKAPQRITHMQRLKDAGDSVSYLLDVAGALEERLGPLLFQLPPQMKKDAPRLRDFLALLPQRCRAAFEFRHQSWFDSEIFTLLRDHHARSEEH